MRLLIFILATGLCLTNADVFEWKKIQPSPIQLSKFQEDSIWHLWRIFVKEFNHIRNSLSFTNFAKNVNAMWKHLRQPSLFTMGVNKFAAMTPAEYSRYLGYRHNPNILASNLPRHQYQSKNLSDTLPVNFDWRKQGRVTGVKDQGNCGSCWAFSAIGAIEGQYYRRKHVLLAFSEQQLVDCSSSFGNNGCNGGLMDYAFNYAKKSGIEKEEDYPYVSGTTGEANICHFNKTLAVAQVKGFVDVPSGNSQLLMEALYLNGPISVAINAAPISFMMYHGGIYDDKSCEGNATSLNHGVLLVGYGQENSVPYWILKNSWGSRWGEHGYVRIKKTENLCGVATAASFPLM